MPITSIPKKKHDEPDDDGSSIMGSSIVDIEHKSTNNYIFRTSSLTTTRGPEDQRTRGPESQRARGPEGQRSRGPEDQNTTL
jgi:hypothetical protein